MIKYNYKGNQYDWLSDIRKVIWNEDRIVFGEWNDETCSRSVRIRGD